MTTNLQKSIISPPPTTRTIHLRPLKRRTRNSLPHKDIHVLCDHRISILSHLGLVTLKMMMQEAREQLCRDLGVTRSHILGFMVRDDLREDIVRFL